MARAMRMEANQELNNLYQNSNSVFYFLRRTKKCVEGGKVLKRKRRTNGFMEEDGVKLWMEHMEKIMKRTNGTAWRN